MRAPWKEQSHQKGNLPEEAGNGTDTYSGSWELEPENEDSLEGEEEGEVVEDGTECEGLKEVEEAEHDPVGEPLQVVLVLRGLDGAEGHIGWETPSDKVGDGGRERVDEDEEGAEEGTACNERGLRDLSPFLEIGQRRVFVQLQRGAGQRGR